MPEALVTSAANCRLEQEARGEMSSNRTRNRASTRRRSGARGARTGPTLDKERLSGGNLHLCEGMVAVRRHYDVEGLYVNMSKGFIGTEGLTGMGAVTGGQDLMLEQGHMELGAAVSDAWLKRAMGHTVFVERQADAAEATAGLRGCMSPAIM